jgi:predicted metal-dependent peptidase
MSSKIRGTISKETLDKEYVSVEEKAKCLATAIYNCTKHHPFIGSVLQSLNIAYSHVIPTAGIMFNTDAKRWDMLVNPYFFCKKLGDGIQGDKHRKAVFLHEISHITHKHPLRVPFLKISARKRMLMNVAADMAINQFIPDLPKGCAQCPPADKHEPCPNDLCPGKCIDVKEYFDEDGKGSKTPWPVNQTMEKYYDLLIKRFDDPDDNDNQDGDGEGNAGGGAESGDIPQTLDEHMWDGAADEKDMLDATEDQVKRAMVKARLSYDDLPGHVKELLDDIKTRRAELNYKALIMAAMKRHASGHNRKNTWTRKSKRFGNKAPGTKVGDLPRLNLYLDTSGSISIEELNEFLSIVDEFLRVGTRKCDISFFHTENYGHRQYKMGQKIERSEIQQGGTELRPVMEDIVRKAADLSIVITDGYYGDVAIEESMRPGQKFPQTLFIISKDGTEKHPLVRLGDTVKVPNSAKA